MDHRRPLNALSISQRIFSHLLLPTFTSTALPRHSSGTRNSEHHSFLDLILSPSPLAHLSILYYVASRTEDFPEVHFRMYSKSPVSLIAHTLICDLQYPMASICRSVVACRLLRLQKAKPEEHARNCTCLISLDRSVTTAPQNVSIRPFVSDDCHASHCHESLAMLSLGLWSRCF